MVFGRLKRFADDCLRFAQTQTSVVLSAAAAQRSRPDSCQAFCSGDSKYSATLRWPSKISAVVCMLGCRQLAWRRCSDGIFQAPKKAIKKNFIAVRIAHLPPLPWLIARRTSCRKTLASRNLNYSVARKNLANIQWPTLAAQLVSTKLPILSALIHQADL